MYAGNSGQLATVCKATAGTENGYAMHVWRLMSMGFWLKLVSIWPQNGFRIENDKAAGLYLHDDTYTRDIHIKFVAVSQAYSKQCFYSFDLVVDFECVHFAFYVPSLFHMTLKEFC